MHLAARALVLTLLPSIAAAQSDSRAAAQVTQVTQQASASASLPASAVSSTGHAAPARILVLECPATKAAPLPFGSPTATPADSLDSARLAALLCARAKGARGPGNAPAELVHADHPPMHPATARTTESPIATPESPAEPQLQVHFFADVKFSATDSTGSKNGFALGQFDLFARSTLSDNLSVLSEATLTALPRNTFSTKLERLLLTFSPSDRFNASVGRFHTGIGYYNAAYHHGTWFQTATGRPLVYAIDGDIGVIPIHTLGVTVNGELPSGALGLHYLVEMGSGRAGQSSAAIAPQPSLNDNNTPSVNVALMARPERVDGLQFGVSVYRDRLTLQDTASAAIDETVAAVHALYKTEVVELLSEAVVIRHRPRGVLPSNDAHGYYAQASRRFGAVRPYVRLDYLDIPATDQLFGFLGRRSGPTLGVRYDFDALAALKLQTSHLKQTTRPTMNRFDAQVSFMF